MRKNKLLLIIIKQSEIKISSVRKTMINFQSAIYDSFIFLRKQNIAIEMKKK